MAVINENVEKILINTGTNSLEFEAGSGGVDTTFDLISLWDETPPNGGDVSSSEYWEAVVPEGVSRIKTQICNVGTLSTNTRYLTSLFIPSTVGYIGANAFQYQTKLEEIDCTENGNAIALQATVFNGCTKLAAVSDNFWNRLSQTGYQSFKDCTSLTTFKIGKNVTTIAGYAFQNCTGLTAIECTEDAEVAAALSISNYAFQYCSALTSIELPARTSSIDSTAFTRCNNLTTITIHKAEDSISGAPWGATNATVIWDG